MKTSTKTYLQILAITLPIQIIGYALFKLFDAITDNPVVPVVILLAAIAVSLILGIVLPLKRCPTRKEKLLTILLLPTNYTWLLVILGLVVFMALIGNILSNMPANFG